MTSTPSFIHLHVHSEFSIVDSLVRLGDLCKQVAKNGMPAVAVTDVCNFFGLIKFYKAAHKSGLKPIIGAELWLTPIKEGMPPVKVVVLCQNNDGYRTLTRIISRAFIEAPREDMPIIPKSWLLENPTGLIILSGGREGDVGQYLIENNEEKAIVCLQEWMNAFPDCFYIELQRTKRPNEEIYIQKSIALASKYDLPVVATGDVVFLEQHDFEAHEARVCIHDSRVLSDSTRERKYRQTQYLKSPQEMVALFQDIPEAIQNTVYIAQRCNVSLELGQSFLPNFPVPEGMTVNSFLRERAHEGLKLRLQKLFQNPDAQTVAKYEDRLNIELDVIINMGFPGYFLIVSDFIQWAKDNKIPVGPGRGSGAGSLVAYVLSITDLDPLAYELLFERFLNPERISMPDFDVDFCMENRDAVIEYVARRYGRQSVSQIVTFGTMAAKAVVRDVGRVLGFPYGFVDKIAKLIPFEIGITLEKSLEQEEAFRLRYQEEEDVKTLIDLALKLEGLTRNVGKHAGGVVIAPSELTDFSALYCEENSTQIVTQFDKDDVESIGLVKFDFLGLRTLTIIDWAVQNVQSQLKQEVDITSIPLTCPATFGLLKKCQTTAVFQLESRGMKDLIRRLEPDCFEEIIALVALFRPGPLQSGMVDDFINRKHGRQQVEYPHPALMPILKPTYGVILYQEQVMQIAQVLAGYSLGQADLLRRAMGKKKPEEMEEQRVFFTKGSIKNGVEEKTATYIFDLMEKFAGYGFNKSHSAAYALVSYQTAWLKAHYPAPFMAAVLSADMAHTDKVVVIIEECQNMKLTVLPPCINHGVYKFALKCPEVQSEGSAVDDNQVPKYLSEIIYGLGAVKGLGEGTIENIVKVREETGPYKNLFDFCGRVDLKKINKRSLEALIRSGAMDCFKQERSTLFASLEKALQLAEQHNKNKQSGQGDMFADVEENEEPEYTLAPPWSDNIRLTGEKETLGLYLTGHPLDEHYNELKRYVNATLTSLTPQGKKNVNVCGLIMAIRTLITKKGDKMAFVTLEDKSGRKEIAIFADLFQKSAELLFKDNIIILSVNVANDAFSGGIKIRADKILSMDLAREEFAKMLKLKLNAENVRPETILILKDILESYGEGNCAVQFEYQKEGVEAQIKVDPKWKIRPTKTLLQDVKRLLGDEAIVLEY